MTEHPGQPQRPPASAYLLIDSRDRGETSTGLLQPNANDFILNARGNAALLYGYFTRVAITQVSFDWYFPLIKENYNDLIRVTNVTTATTSTIQLSGQTPYVDYDTLAAQLETLLRAAPVGNPALTVTFESAYTGFLISTNNGDQLQFVSPLVADPTRGTLYKTLTKTYRTLGINNYQMSTAITDMQCCPPRAATSYLDIMSDRLTKFQRVKDADTDQQQPRNTQIARVYITPPGQRIIVENTVAPEGPGTQPFTICVDYNTPKHIKWSPGEALYQLDLQVRDMDGDLLPWNGLEACWEYQLTLVASET